MKVCTTCGSQWPDDTKFCPNDGTTLRSDKAADLVGSVIADRYHIEKKLGEGGMGAVYLGQHVKMGRKSAIKVMAQSMANDPEAIARFNREAANAARINHPNVCAIYDFGETPDGLIYLAMEFIEGSSLSDLLKSQGALPPQRAASILEQTANALQAAHDLGIVHRDLKPDNIMLTKGRDGADVVKVVDFGIAKAMGGEEGQKVTKTGLVVGTPEYMSPEQLSGDVLDGRSDIYSLALVLFRMLSGALPFQADTAQEMMIKRLTDDPMRLDEALPGANFPPRLQQVMDKALQRMPADRYSSAAQFGRDVVEAVSRMPAPASVDTDGATMLLEAAEVGATAALAKTWVAGARAKEPSTPATPAPRSSAPAPEKKKRPMAAIAASVAVLAVGGAGAAIFLKGGGNSGSAAPPADSVPVTENTAARQPAANPGGQQRQEQTAAEPQTPQARELRTTEQRPTVEPVPAAPTAAELGAVHALLDSVLDWTLADATRLQAITRGREVYENSRWPNDVRASAASLVAQGYSELGNTREACTWITRAITFAPANLRYQEIRSLWSCP